MQCLWQIPYWFPRFMEYMKLLFIVELVTIPFGFREHWDIHATRSAKGCLGSTCISLCGWKGAIYSLSVSLCQRQ